MTALLVGLAAMPAAAQDRPAMLPTRDVAVTYRFTGAAAGQGMAGMSMSWLAAQQLMRNDMGGVGWSVVDHRNQRGFMVMEQMRMVMDLPMQQAMQQFGPQANGNFTREGTTTVAGLPCTTWRFENPQGQGRACITADGVTLRSEGTFQGHSGGMEATQVTYAAQDPARFQRPQGYQSMQMPGGAPGGMPGGMPGGSQGGRPPAK
jgi:hypothetical protein